MLLCFWARIPSQVHHKLWSRHARSVLAHFARDVSTYSQLSQTLVDMQKACFAELGVDVEHGYITLTKKEFTPTLRNPPPSKSPPSYREKLRGDSF